MTAPRGEPVHGSEQAATDQNQIAELEHALRIAKARFEGVVEIAADAIISVDEHQLIRLFNLGAQRVFGYAADEVLGKPLDVLLPERFRAIHRQHVSEFGRSAERARRMGYRRDISGLRKGGEEFPAEASISRYREGANLVFNVVLRDITERRRAEERQRFLAQAGALLPSSLDHEVTLARAARLAVPALAEGCCVDLVTDQTLREVAVAHNDPELESRLRRRRLESPVDLRGTHPIARAVRTREPVVLRQPESNAQERDVAPELEAIGAQFALFVPLVARQAVLGVVSLYSSRRPFDGEDLVFAQDFAQRTALAIDNARLYEAAQLAIRSREDVVALVSHDLRNPVSAISMMAGHLLEPDGATVEERLRESVEVIQQAARQADALIQDLLDVSRIEGGRLRLDAVSDDLRATVDEVMETMTPLARDGGLSLEAHVAEVLPPVLFDHRRVLQALSNLVGNAIKFTPSGGTVSLWVEAEEDEVVIAVRDTGIGIPAEYLPHLFDRYWQGERQARGGAGLGLAIAKGIIEAHGGRIWVESTRGSGSTFRFALPAVPWHPDPGL